MTNDIRGYHFRCYTAATSFRVAHPALTEFGKMVKVQEAENQIVIDYEVYDKKPSDTELLPAIERHEKLTGRTPDLVAADNGFFSAKNEAVAHEKGVKRISIANRSTQSEARRQTQKKRWFKNGQKWRTVARAESVCSRGGTD